MKSLAYAFASVVLFVSSQAYAAAHAVTDNNKTVTITCKSGDIVYVTGNKNKLTVTGTCAKVATTGNENHVDVQQVDEIMTPGNKNTVVWHKGPGDKAPKVLNAGNDNSISKAK